MKLPLVSLKTFHHLDQLEKIDASRKNVESIVGSDKTVYGVNTGFGQLSQIKIDKKDQRKLQLNLIRSHSAGIGDNLDVSAPDYAGWQTEHDKFSNQETNYAFNKS